MPTIIESLVFEIGIDAKKLKDDAKEANETLRQVEGQSKRAVTESEERARKTEDTFRGVADAIQSLFMKVATAYGGTRLVDMAKDINRNAEAMGFLAENLNLSTTRLEAWQLAAERTGGTAAGMTAQIQKASQVVALAQRGEQIPGGQEFFKQGGTRADLESIDSYLSAVSRILQPYFAPGGDPLQGMTVADKLGINPDALNLLKQGPEYVHALVKELEKEAATNNDLARSAHDVTNAFRETNQALKQVASSLLQELNPTLLEVGKYTKKLIGDTKTALAPGAGPAFLDFVEDWGTGGKGTGMWGKLGVKRTLDIALDGVIDPQTGQPVTDVDPDEPPKKESPVMPPTWQSPVMPPQMTTPLLKSPTSESGSGKNLTDEQVIQKLMGFGWSRNQAIGLAAMVKPESNYNPAAEGDKKDGVYQAYGIAQWHPDRQAEFARVYGKSIRGSSDDEQLAFMNYELTQGKFADIGRQMRGMTDPAEVARLGTKKYEIPAQADYQAEIRANIARQMDILRMGNYATTGARTQAPAIAGGSAVASGTPEVYVNAVTINTQSQDPKGIKREFADNMGNVARQAERGTF